MTTRPVRSVDLWTAELDAVPAARLEVYRSWLSPDERAALERFATARLAGQWLLTRALSRWVLSHYEPEVAPAEWRFERTEEGRPFVVGPLSRERLATLPSWNLANADGFVVCGVSEHLVGVDVESMTRGVEILASAPRVTSPSEQAQLSSLPELERARLAVQLWTLKEAYLKARGHGIALRLERITISVPRGGPCRLEDVSALGDDPAAWQLELALPNDAAHVVAVAVRRGIEPDLSVVVRPIVPE